MTLKQFRELTKDIGDDVHLYYHAYDKGCCLHAYTIDDMWLYPKGGAQIKGVVMNPGEGYDPRRPVPTPNP